MYHVFGATPVNAPNYTTSVSLGLFTTTDLDPGWDNHTSRCALHEIQHWLRDESRKRSRKLGLGYTFLRYEVPQNWFNLRNGTYAPQKLGHIVCARDTAAYITMYHGEIFPFWGDVYSDVIAQYVDLSEISLTTLAKLVSF